ncbi:MAG TPA: DUF58 domain-containing protein [Candidatus Acidoferrales bacterium]|nr:DUF58 domain-containing protein [Candidatus Acidoferrales bacterium]
MAPLLLDREFLKTLEEVTFLCRQDLAGPIGADHRSRSHGPGMEFADYRRYSSGDDPRFLDWNAYLRLGKLFLKIFETERHVPVRILLDRSESMDCEASGESKFLYAQRLAATFSYLALLHLDTITVVPFAERLGKPIVVSGGRENFWPVLKFLGELSCNGGTDLYRSVKEFLVNFPSRGVIVVISDFLDEEGCKRSVEMLRSAGHDFVILQVHSAEEQRPSASGELLLEEAETGARRIIQGSPENAALYERAFLEFSERLERVTLRNGGRYARAFTGVCYQEFVLRTLRSGRVLA